MDQPARQTTGKVKNTPDVTWVFDLDNTLYPEHCNLFSHIDLRMGEFISNLLAVDKVEARRVQKDYFVRFGTTLRGLINLHGIKPEDFLNFVHDIDLSALHENQPLSRHLAALKGRKYVFTNGDVPYATRVLEKIGIYHHMDGIFDISKADYVPKPHDETYKRFIDHFDIDPSRSVMFEDMARNLVPAAKLGMTTVWMRSTYQWGSIGYDRNHIHYEAENLVEWFDEHMEEL